MSSRSLLSRGLGNHQAHMVVGRPEDLAGCHMTGEAALGSSRVIGEAALSSSSSVTGDFFT